MTTQTLDELLDDLETFAYESDFVTCEKIRAKIKEALAQPEQEPVAEVVIGKYPWDYGLSVVYLEKCLTAGTKLYTTPPQRTWVGLTDTEKYALSNDVAQRGVPVFEAICEAEAILKGNNT